MVQPPVIFVPGITATSLEDYYPIPPEEVWSAVLYKRYERISLHPDDIRYEAIEPARVGPYSLFGLIYEDLIEALRHDLTGTRDKPTPVFGFAYDWRQDCTRSADLLDEFVDEVLARAALIPHYRDEAFRVDLVGHSMGGLIIADYLKRHGKKKKVRRVVSIGTPVEGSIDAIQKLATGMGSLTGENPRDRERETARTLPSIYQLLPTYRGAVKASPGLSSDLFQTKTWQPSIRKTFGEYIRLHHAKIEAEVLFRQYLSAAKHLRQRVRGLSLRSSLPEGNGAWLAIVGVGAPTQVQVKISLWQRKPWFEFQNDIDEWPANFNTGDGTVPLLGACPSFLDRAQLVCISPEDFSRWELKDRVLAKTTGFHAALPTVNVIQRLTVRFLRPSFDGEVWGRRLPGVTKTLWPRWIEERK